MKLTLGRTRWGGWGGGGGGGGGGGWGGGGGGGGRTPLCFIYFIKRMLSGRLSISVAVRLSLRHIYSEFGENRRIHIGDIK